MTPQKQHLLRLGQGHKVTGRGLRSDSPSMEPGDFGGHVLDRFLTWRKCVGGWVGLLIRFAGSHGTPSGVQGNYTLVVVSNQASQVPLNF